MRIIGVATHETGHVECLGHMLRSTAIMQQGKVLFYTPGSDDLNAMQSISTSYVPS